MKKLLVFLIFLNSHINQALACGPFYPYGEDIRFRLLSTNGFAFDDFEIFKYSANTCYHLYSQTKSSENGLKVGTELNCSLWQERCNNVPALSDVKMAVYQLEKIDKAYIKTNSFVRWLYEENDFEAINYLNFAKKCESFNSVFAEDPWERNTGVAGKRLVLIESAVNKAKKTNDLELGKRYAFLAIRLCFYQNDFEKLQEIYKQYFNYLTPENIVDFWAMFFVIKTEENKALKNYMSAQVFMNAPDKRLSVSGLYNEYTPYVEVLKFCKNNDEKAHVYTTASMRKENKSLFELKQIYALKPNSNALTFLLFREINKLEDWILTPYYTNFSPTISVDSEEYDGFEKMQQRISADREYAQQILDFVESVDVKKVSDNIAWLLAKSTLCFLVKDYNNCLNNILIYEKSENKNPLIASQFKALKILCINTNQTIKNAVFQGIDNNIELQEILDSNNSYLFAIARELEFLGNTTDAALLLSKIKNKWTKRTGNYYWQTRLKHHTLYSDFYENYFFYLDAEYTSKQVQALTDALEKYNENDNAWKYKDILEDKDRLYDLLGTKYLRDNDLERALIAYKKVNRNLWNSDEYSYKTYLNANPFYTNFYTEHQKSWADTIVYNKKQVVEKLLSYLVLAENSHTKHREYYYFQVANCYFNMSQYGNSWIMKRYFWTINETATKLPDDDEYFGCELAKKYYLKAKVSSKSKEFSALCLRMAARCESYRINHKHRIWWQSNYNNSNKENFNDSNYYYGQLQQEYPEYYLELTENCESFERYYQSYKLVK